MEGNILRSHVNHDSSAANHQIARPKDFEVDRVAKLSSEEDEAYESAGEHQEKHSKRARLHNLGTKTKAKTKKLLRLSDGHDAIEKDSEVDTDEVLQEIKEDPAFNPKKVAEQTTDQSTTSNAPHDKPKGTLKSIAKAIAHPKEAIISKATRTTASKLSSVQKPHLSQKADLEFLEAHDNLSRAQSIRTSRQVSSDEDEDDEETAHCRKKVEVLEAHRESLRVAWTTSHIERVRVVPKRHFEFPQKEAFIERNDRGEFVRYRWEKWLGHVLVYYTQDFSAQYIDDFDELPFDIPTFRGHVERTVMASTPWQSWLMRVRAVYRWEDPSFTGKWLALYIVLWYTEHLVGFVWGYIIYLVVKNRYFPTNVKSLRASVQRAVDREGTAYHIGELIDKHGREEWLQPLIDELGPHAQLQVGDIANMLEVFSNFYAWKAPSKTKGTLFFFSSCLLLSVLADTAYCMKIFWFITGGFFFLSWPISSHHPKYRYLASPFKWILWDIPTHAEWSFQYLRRQAQATREKIIGQKVEKKYASELAIRFPSAATAPSSTPDIMVDGVASAALSSDEDEDWHSVRSVSSILSEADVMAFRVQWQGHRGRLIIYSSGVRFVQSLPKKELWDLPFIEITEMRKSHGSRAPKAKIPKLLAVDQLTLKAMDGNVFFLESVHDRDEAFNCIIGFSNLQWQSLQGGPRQEGGRGHNTGSV